MTSVIEQLVVIDLPQFRESRGVLVPVEFSQFVPFEVRRMFWIADVPLGGVRGGHAHKHCHQFAICVAGRVAIEARDGRAKRTIELAVGQALHIRPGIFTTETIIAPGTILSVLCDRPYEPTDYVYKVGQAADS
jgi:dTDP-4-dehydrorhamnose 3,5-epimerase-like enzyme